jgi:tetratricopeptide (TPR) repeat protein
LDPKLPGALWNLALVLEQQGEQDQAEKLYGMLPEDNPESAEALFRVGYLRLLRGDFRGGAEAFTACLKKRNSWPEARLNVGIACWKAGDLAQARAAFESVLAARPGSVDALRGLAALSLDEGDYPQAFRLHQKLIDSGERGADLFYNAGLICQKRNEVRDAIVYYREALKIDPDLPEALLNLGHALMYIGAKDEAKACWRKAISIKPELAEDYFDSPSA